MKCEQRASIDAVSPPVVDHVGERVANLARRTDSRRFARETPANSPLGLRPQGQAARRSICVRRGGVQVLVPVSVSDRVATDRREHLAAPGAFDRPGIGGRVFELRFTAMDTAAQLRRR